MPTRTWAWHTILSKGSLRDPVANVGAACQLRPPSRASHGLIERVRYCSESKEDQPRGSGYAEHLKLARCAFIVES